MRDDKNIFGNIDWITVAVYFALVLIGWLVIYSTNYDEETGKSIFSLDLNSGKQFLRILSCVAIIAVILTVDFRVYDSIAYIIYGATILLLIFVLVFGREVAGSKSWFELGGFKLQPSEFAKFAAALAIAKAMSIPNFKLENTKNLLLIGAIIALPAIMIILQGDTGTALVFAALVVPLYREGLNPVFIVIGLTAVIIFILTLFVPKLFLASAIGIIVVLIIIFGKKILKELRRPLSPEL